MVSTSLHSTRQQCRKMIDTCANLFDRHPEVDMSPPPDGPYCKIGTPLQATAFAGCSRNARLLLEVLPISASICYNTVGRVDRECGKYQNPLVAAVARSDEFDDLDDEPRHTVLRLLLEQVNVPQNEYRAALEMALKLRRKDDFKLIVQSMIKRAGKDVKKLSQINTMLAEFKRVQMYARQARPKRNEHTCLDDDTNGDFGDDIVYCYQEIDDQVYFEPVEDQVALQEEPIPQDAGQEQYSPGRPAGYQEATVIPEPHRGIPALSLQDHDSGAAKDQVQMGRPNAELESPLESLGYVAREGAVGYQGPDEARNARDQEPGEASDNGDRNQVNQVTLKIKVQVKLSMKEWENREILANTGERFMIWDLVKS
ncbi:hypothetical protein BDW59DRAFT_157085 [Aspergillus cavernicola]|uniref:Uncharacterized protein n=1 Tax=Aspergillus cavernicola TaxID=176166 RepID=A0ABR4IYS6_9EURO